MDKCVGRKAVQRKRKMKYFIDAANDIIENSGVGAVTIRGISDIAGYNSATLYNYFKNIDHLIYYSYMKYILELDSILRPLIHEKTDSVVKLKTIWSEFSRYAYDKVDVIYMLMFSSFTVEFNDIIHDYLDVFRDNHIILEGFENKMIFKHSVFDVITDSIKDFGGEFCIEEEGITELEEFVMTYFQGQLARLKTVDQELELENYINKMNRFMDYLLWTYTIKDR